MVSATFTPGLSGRRSSTSSFYHGDALGSTRSQTSSSQSVTDTKRYDAFGMLIASSGSNPTPFGFVGGSQYQTDADSGLMLLGHRYYDASIGRFISRDPAYAGTNYYAYCENNPLGHTDPTGLDDSWIIPGGSYEIGHDGTGKHIPGGEPGGGSAWIKMPGQEPIEITPEAPIPPENPGIIGRMRNAIGRLVDVIKGGGDDGPGPGSSLGEGGGQIGRATGSGGGAAVPITIGQGIAEGAELAVIFIKYRQTIEIIGDDGEDGGELPITIRFDPRRGLRGGLFGNEHGGGKGLIMPRSWAIGATMTLPLTSSYAAD